MLNTKHVAGPAAVAGLALLSVAAPTQAAVTYQVITNDTSAQQGQQVGLITYNSLSDLINGNVASAAFTQIVLSGGYVVGGLAHDASGYRLMTNDTYAPPASRSACSPMPA